MDVLSISFLVFQCSKSLLPVGVAMVALYVGFYLLGMDYLWRQPGHFGLSPEAVHAIARAGLSFSSALREFRRFAASYQGSRPRAVAGLSRTHS